MIWGEFILTSLKKINADQTFPLFVCVWDSCSPPRTLNSCYLAQRPGLDQYDTRKRTLNYFPSPISSDIEKIMAWNSNSWLEKSQLKWNIFYMFCDKLASIKRQYVIKLLFFKVPIKWLPFSTCKKSDKRDNHFKLYLVTSQLLFSPFPPHWIQVSQLPKA